MEIDSPTSSSQPSLDTSDGEIESEDESGDDDVDGSGDFEVKLQPTCTYLSIFYDCTKTNFMSLPFTSLL